MMEEEKVPRMNTIPLDDCGLEMEELEGLVNVTTRTGIGTNPHPASKKSGGKAGKTLLASSNVLLMHGRNKSRLVLVGALVAVLIIVALIGVGGRARLVEDSLEGSGAGDVEGKVEASAWANASSDAQQASTQSTQKTNAEESQDTSAKDGDADNDAEESEEENVDGNDTTEEEEVKEKEEEKEEEVEEKDWGHWKFYDGGEDERPKGDYCGKYRNRDITAEDFPEEAWQTDAVYVNHFLEEAHNLLARAKDAIYAEYGRDDASLQSDDDKKRRFEWFHIELLDMEKEDDDVKPSNECLDKGGYSSQKSMENLSRRLLHAMMTNDEFAVTLGGHSAAAGHGNHFVQSYIHQFHEIMSPIFQRLGVKLITRNISNGGLGTYQNALGSGDIYGDVDVIVWDSGMTEKDAGHIDVFYRQSMLSGEKVPFLMHVGNHYDVMQALHKDVGADVGGLGKGTYFVPITEDEEQVKKLPFAAQYLVCDDAMKDICSKSEHRFRTKCWVDRPDVTPPVEQEEHVGSQVVWHPGFREHRLRGRVLAMWILEALEMAVEKWMDVTMVEGDPLPDEYWHMSSYYDETRAKLQSEMTLCHTPDGITDRLCKVALHGRTMFTPRAHPNVTSLTSIVKPTKDGYMPTISAKMLYEGEDVPNPALEIPHGEVDVKKIVGARRTRRTRRRRTRKRMLRQTSPRNSSPRATVQRSLADNSTTTPVSTDIIPGRWSVKEHPPGYCDGTSTSICGRQENAKCLLVGHHDSRGTLIGDCISGWVVFQLQNVTEGIIIINHDWYHKDVEATQDWNGEDEERRFRRRRMDGKPSGSLEDVREDDLNEQERKLGGGRVPPPEEVILDFAINGEITTWNSDKIEEMTVQAERVVLLLQLLDDPEWSTSKKAGEDVELAIRIRGCKDKRKCVLAIPHVYWA